MQCDECSRLLAAHLRLKAERADAKQQLKDSAERQIPAVQYKALWIRANEAWIDAESARLELEQHKRRLHSEAN